MDTKELQDSLSFIKKEIITRVFVNDRRIVDEGHNELSWIMDFRKVLLEPVYINSVVAIFYDKITKEFGDDFQVGGIEVASIPIITGLVMKSVEMKNPRSGFFIRKSRKKTGLLNMIEGSINNDSSIILVDDILNSGRSFLRQIEVIESLGKKVTALFVIVKYRDESYYEDFKKRGIAIISLFDLNDFTKELALKNVTDKKNKELHSLYNVNWTFASESPHLDHVVPKSGPVLSDGILYFGADNGHFWALDSITGDPIWNYKVLFGQGGKTIFSTPCVYKDSVFFGAYDGNFYSLDKKTGKRLWVASDADWIGSSPCVSELLSLVYVGMEYGFWKKKGGITAYDAKTGKKIWDFFTEEYVHCSPVYSHIYNLVICGSNEGKVYAIDAKTGSLKWSYDAQGEVKAGGSFSFDHKYIAFGTFNKTYIVLDVKTGNEIKVFKTLENNYSTPVWVNEQVIICTSLDKRIYCFSLLHNKSLWQHTTSSRIFSSPTIYKNIVYFGNNSARLYGLDIETGDEVALFQTIERITNKVIIDPVTETLFLTTIANEVISLDLKKDNL